MRVFPREPYIARFFALFFWGYFGVTYVSYLLDGREYGVVIVTLAFEALLTAGFSCRGARGCPGTDCWACRLRLSRCLLR